jgi:hypothetical protein
MEALYNRALYGEGRALQIETMGNTAVSIANRWMLGWPDKVSALIAANQYMPALQAQREQEVDVLSNATGMSHLSPVEILQMHEISLEPPSVTPGV